MSILDDIRDIHESLKSVGLADSVLSVRAGAGEDLSVVLADSSVVSKKGDGSIHMERVLKLPDMVKEVIAHVEPAADPALPDEASPEIAADNPNIDQGEVA